MLQRLIVAFVAVICIAMGSAMAQPRPVTLWHVFNLETDMIYGGIKSFNETQSTYRIDAAPGSGEPACCRADQGDRHRIGA